MQTRKMQIPEHFTPMQKYIIEKYTQVRNTSEAARLTHHKPNSSYVRGVIRKYKLWMVKESMAG